MIDAWASLPASVLGLASTAHAALGVIRAHRSPKEWSTWWSLPSLVLAVSPWVSPVTAVVAGGLVVHVGWVVLCRSVFHRSSAAGQAAAARPLDFVPLKVLSVADISPTIRSFRMVRPPGLVFEAGQFLTVRVHVNAKAFVRCYSISSSPEDPHLEISVKRQGLVSSALHASVRAGSHLFVRLPAGRFTYPSDSRHPIVLVAGGVGITPLISMARHAMATEPWRAVTLLYSARGEQELAFWNELSRMADRHPQFHAVATLTESSAGWTGRVGRLTAAALTECVRDPTSAVYLMCGPSEMLNTLRDTLLGLGVPDDRIRFEVFQPAVAIGARGRTSDEGVVDQAPHTVTFSRSQTTTSAGAAESLLDVAESAGVQIPSVCRAGVCRTCRTRVSAGEVDCSSDALGGEQVEGWVLPCVAHAKSDCTLDA